MIRIVLPDSYPYTFLLGRRKHLFSPLSEQMRVNVQFGPESLKMYEGVQVITQRKRAVSTWMTDGRLFAFAAESLINVRLLVLTLRSPGHPEQRRDHPRSGKPGPLHRIRCHGHGHLP